MHGRFYVPYYLDYTLQFLIIDSGYDILFFTTTTHILYKMSIKVHSHNYCNIYCSYNNIAIAIRSNTIYNMALIHIVNELSSVL